MFAVVSGVPSRLWKIKASGDLSAITDSRRRNASTVNDGNATTRFDLSVFGCGWREVPTPRSDTTVPQIRSVAGLVVTSRSMAAPIVWTSMCRHRSRPGRTRANSGSWTPGATPNYSRHDQFGFDPIIAGQLAAGAAFGLGSALVRGFDDHRNAQELLNAGAVQLVDAR